MTELIAFLPHSGEPFPSEHALQAMYEAALRRRRREHRAAPMTVEAVMYELRTDGLSALKVQNCQHRLAELSAAQVSEVIERLERLRPNHPAITDELLLQVGKLR
jgi:hypothetical protein